MKLLNLIFADKEIPVNIPETVEDLSWGQAKRLVKLEKSPDFTLELVSIMTGIPVDRWRESTEKRVFLELAIECQSFVNQWAMNLANVAEDPVSPVIDWNGKKIHLPDDIGKKTIGQYTDTKTIAWKWEEEYDEENHDVVSSFELYEKVFRIYLQPLISEDGKYNFPEAMGLDISEVKYVHVIQWAYFFLSNLER